MGYEVPESSSTNCVVGAPGGTAYNCNFSTTCPTGTVTGTTTYPWQAQIGSADFCAAAQHFVQAFADASISGVTTNANCDLVPPTGGWPSVVTAINTAQGNGCAGGFLATGNTCFFVRRTEPRQSLGYGLGQEICALFSPAWGAWTTMAGNPFSCDNSNTGSGNAACGGGGISVPPPIQPHGEIFGFKNNTIRRPQQLLGPRNIRFWK